MMPEQSKLDVTAAAREAAAKMLGKDLAAPAKPEVARTPLGVPVRKLEVPDIPGYYLQWFRGTSRVQQALRAGFEHVLEEEIGLNSTLIAGDPSGRHNGDLGSIISVASGDEATANGAVRLYLMKQRVEHHLQDMGLREEASDRFAEAMRVSFQTGRPLDGKTGETAVDLSGRYVKDAKVPSLFQKKTPR